MSRLTKPILKSAIQSAILGDGSGESQMILTRPADEAFRMAVADRVAPGGGMLARRPGNSGTIHSGNNLMGDTPNRILGSAPSYDPKFVSVNPYLNPYLDYVVDKVSEGVAVAHQEWQARQRVRGTVVKEDKHRHPIEEIKTHLPFQTEQGAIEDQSDHETRGDLIDTGLRDYQSAVTPRVAALTMAVTKAQAVNTDTALLGGMSLDEVPKAEMDPAGARAAVAGKVSGKLAGQVIQSERGPVFSDAGKYISDMGGAQLQPPGGSPFAGLFMFAAWKKVVDVLYEKARRIIPPAAKLSPRGMDLAKLAARNLSSKKENS